MTGHILSVENLSIQFRADDGVVNAVNDVSFNLAQGEVLGFLGESGSGKSVTLRALLGLLPAHTSSIQGQMHFHGAALHAMPERQFRSIRGTRIAMVFQEAMSAFDPLFSIGDQIAETIVCHDGVSWRDARRRAKEMLDMVQIPSPARRMSAYPHEMSGGMLQRAMIALALACRPELLLADEPTTALDVSVQIQIVLLLRELQRDLGMSVIFVTHDVGVATEISDRLAVMYAGRFVEFGPTATVIDAPSHPYSRGLLASNVANAQHGERLNAIPGAPPDLTASHSGCEFAARCPLNIASCKEAPPPLTTIGSGHEVRCIRAAST